MNFSYQLADIDKAVKWVLNNSQSRNCWLLFGELGTGKTTFVKALGMQLNFNEEVSSPTYSLINHYHYNTKNGQLITAYHADLYRLNDLEEALDIGLEDLLEKADALKIIEWPDKALSLMPDNRLELYFTIKADNIRNLELKII